IFVLTGCTSNNLMKDYKGFTKKDHHYVTTDSETIIKNLEDSKGSNGLFKKCENSWNRITIHWSMDRP
ncbi:hypothetical protein PT115_09250, partial [Erysipelothrix rhusiopathiae]|nr:hypothetical protein [Erysipelothrix rhusiopathiae]